MRWVLGELERRNPLPPGTYWVTVPVAWARRWTAWLDRNRARVRVLSTRELKEQVPHPEHLGPEHAMRVAAVDYLFTASAPVNWEGPGIPTKATPQTKLEETAQVPAPEKTALETVSSFFESVPPLLVLGLLVAIATASRRY